MAGYVPYKWTARLLEATAGRTAIATGTVYFGLAVSLADDPLASDLTNITEVTTAGYARVAVPAFSAATTAPPNKITTPTAFTFAALTADMVFAANYAFLCDAATGTAGNLRYIFELETPVLGRVGEPINIPAGSLVIE
jgi:hypothetical protein